MKKLILKWLFNDYIVQSRELEARSRELEAHSRELEARSRELEARSRELETQSLKLGCATMQLTADLISTQQRLDALCKVCGVEVVITMGEVFTAAIVDDGAVSRMRGASILWEIDTHIEDARKDLAKMTSLISKLKLDATILKSQRA